MRRRLFAQNDAGNYKKLARAVISTSYFGVPVRKYCDLLELKLLLIERYDLMEESNKIKEFIAVLQIQWYSQVL